MAPGGRRTESRSRSAEILSRSAEIRSRAPSAARAVGAWRSSGSETRRRRRRSSRPPGAGSSSSIGVWGQPWRSERPGSKTPHVPARRGGAVVSTCVSSQSVAIRCNPLQSGTCTPSSESRPRVGMRDAVLGMRGSKHPIEITSSSSSSSSSSPRSERGIRSSSYPSSSTPSFTPPATARSPPPPPLPHRLRPASKSNVRGARRPPRSPELRPPWRPPLAVFEWSAAEPLAAPPSGFG